MGPVGPTVGPISWKKPAPLEISPSLSPLWDAIKRPFTGGNEKPKAYYLSLTIWLVRCHSQLLGKMYLKIWACASKVKFHLISHSTTIGSAPKQKHMQDTPNWCGFFTSNQQWDPFWARKKPTTPSDIWEKSCQHWHQMKQHNPSDSVQALLWWSAPDFASEHLGVSKNSGFSPKMDGLFHGTPYLKWMIWGETPLFFGNIHLETGEATGMPVKGRVPTVLLGGSSNELGNLWKQWKPIEKDNKTLTAIESYRIGFDMFWLISKNCSF